MVADQGSLDTEVADASFLYHTEESAVVGWSALVEVHDFVVLSVEVAREWIRVVANGNPVCNLSQVDVIHHDSIDSCVALVDCSAQPAQVVVGGNLVYAIDALRLDAIDADITQAVLQFRLIEGFLQCVGTFQALHVNVFVGIGDALQFDVSEGVDGALAVGSIIKCFCVSQQVDVSLLALVDFSEELRELLDQRILFCASRSAFCCCDCSLQACAEFFRVVGAFLVFSLIVDVLLCRVGACHHTFQCATQVSFIHTAQIAQAGQAKAYPVATAIGAPVGNSNGQLAILAYVDSHLVVGMTTCPKGIAAALEAVQTIANQFAHFIVDFAVGCLASDVAVLVVDSILDGNHALRVSHYVVNVLVGVDDSRVVDAGLVVGRTLSGIHLHLVDARLEAFDGLIEVELVVPELSGIVHTIVAKVVDGTFPTFLLFLEVRIDEQEGHIGASLVAVGDSGAEQSLQGLDLSVQLVAAQKVILDDVGVRSVGVSLAGFHISVEIFLQCGALSAVEIVVLIQILSQIGALCVILLVSSYRSVNLCAQVIGFVHLSHQTFHIGCLVDFLQRALELCQQGLLSSYVQILCAQVLVDVTQDVQEVRLVAELQFRHLDGIAAVG